MHEWYLRDFLSQEGFGNERLSPFPVSYMLTLGEKRHVVSSRRLIGLWVHDEPRIYETSALMKRSLRKVESRPLHARETEAVAKLRRGAGLHVDGDRIYGAIRATEDCLVCHAVEPGYMRGAFRYELTPVRDSDMGAGPSMHE